MTEARVILALAAEADDDFIWTRLADIQSNMFVSRITRFEGQVIALFDGLPASTSRAL
jgi:hypothetical protein